MNNAAIIVFRRYCLPKAFKFFAVPRIDKAVELNNADDKIGVYIVKCPVLKDPENNRRAAMLLDNLCLENNISFFIGKNIEYYLGSGLEQMEKKIERGTADEIKGIKDLAVLIKLSREKNVNMLNKNMCFIGASCSYKYIDAMTAEAAVVYIYEHEKMESDLKKSIFERLMSEKGVSAIFTKDLGKAISQCDIVLADNSVVIEPIKRFESVKTLFSDNTAAGFEKINRVKLWYNSLEGLKDDNPIVFFNDELLCILRHFYKDRSIIDFIRKFPYISFFRTEALSAHYTRG